MLKECKRHLYMNRKDFLLSLLVTFGGALFFSILSWVIAFFGKGLSVSPLGSIAFYFIGGLLSPIFLVGGIGYQFNMALKMGAVRRLYIPVAVLYGWASCFILLLLGNLWHFGEGAILRAVGATDIPSLYLPVWGAAAIALTISIFGSWSGAILMHYGRRGFWVLWGIWMFASLFGSQIASAITSESRQDPFASFVKGIATFFIKWPAAGLWVVAGGILLAIACHTWTILYKAPAHD